MKYHLRCGGVVSVPVYVEREGEIEKSADFSGTICAIRVVKVKLVVPVELNLL